jgi:hypothetical protein
VFFEVPPLAKNRALFAVAQLYVACPRYEQINIDVVLYPFSPEKNLKEPVTNAETMHEGLPNFFPEYYKRRAGNKIFIRAIVPRNQITIERTKANQEEMRDTRFLPDEKMTFSPEVNIYNNKILLVSWKEQMAIIIESKELADLQKLTFNLLWDTLPKN